MSHLDDELSRALADADASAREDGAGATAPEGDASHHGQAAAQAFATPEGSRGPKRKGTRGLGLLIGLLLVMGTVLTLVFTSAEEAVIYSVKTDELLREKERYLGRSVRVEGDLVPGTLRYRAEPCEYRFTMQKSGQPLNVRYPQCVIPDTFRDVPGQDVMVTAEGSLTPEGYFEATHIMAKCPSKYEMENRAKKGETMPNYAVPQVLPTFKD